MKEGPGEQQTLNTKMVTFFRTDFSDPSYTPSNLGQNLNKCIKSSVIQKVIRGKNKSSTLRDISNVVLGKVGRYRLVLEEKK